MKQKKHIIISILIISVFSCASTLFSQNVLVDSVNCTDIAGTWEHFMDTLRAHGATILYYPELNWSELYSIDLLCLIAFHFSYDNETKTSIIEYTRNGGNIVMWTLSSRFGLFYNDLITNQDWQTTLEIGDTLPHWITDNPFNLIRFLPFTNNVIPFGLSGPPEIICGNNAYPIAFADINNYHPVVAISYPFLQEENCNSFIVLMTGVHHMEIWYITEPGEYRLGSNILLTAAGIPGYELEPCAVPEPFIIQVDSSPNCANPGDTITLTGNNLWQGSNGNIGGDVEIYIGDTVVIPIEYSDYAPNCSTLTNTWLKFICPELPTGSYFIQLGHKAILFDAGEIQIPCEADYEPNTCIAYPLPFSPNNDGINDYCKFEYPGMSEDNGVVSIFNLDNTLLREVRNGDVQYSSKGTIFWDGRDSDGNVVNNGVYIYLVKVGSKIVCNGTVYVVR